MFESLTAEKQLYPPAAFLSSLITLVIGMIISKNLISFAYTAVLFVLFSCFGMFKALWKITAAALVFGCIIGGLSCFTSGRIDSFYQNVVRTLILCICAVPMAGIDPARLTRCMNRLKCPRVITLGMLITLRFIPFTVSEIKRIREAVRVRGMGVNVKGGYLYRTFFLPLIMRITSISDILSLSLETRGFSLENNGATVYAEVGLKARDIVFFILILAVCVSGVTAWKLL